MVGDDGAATERELECSSTLPTIGGCGRRTTDYGGTSCVERVHIQLGGELDGQRQVVSGTGEAELLSEPAAAGSMTGVLARSSSAPWLPGVRGPVAGRLLAGAGRQRFHQSPAEPAYGVRVHGVPVVGEPAGELPIRLFEQLQLW